MVEAPPHQGETDIGPHRSEPGTGESCYVYVLGRAEQFADSMIPSYGQITAGCGPNLGEDFTRTMWPVVVKIKPTVTEQDLIQHLRDLADLIDRHPTAETRQRPLADRPCPECGERRAGGEVIKLFGDRKN